ncbi:uncharacterized protein PV09_07574 [Verruconis gallopava]|uniref:Uncharacterized protein n=1 Tax=Verruconis gallopava TaxID=253628 RepID=A0A0D2A3R3_9PEZI|nr:uncharacterized protein PV09_07574 [Verruconis gallopava]KIW01060.1 hypothetical protein PV09_07574 [Verruconis gallopava]
MDSMRSLNTSLPHASSPRKQRSQPPEHLLAQFKQAALSVTNLYKAAASEHDKAYHEGYQDALEELLSFLDKENLGLQDGEGWRVRQWATERFEGTSAATAANGSESDDEHEEEKTTQPETSPTLGRKATPELQPTLEATLNPSPAHTRSESAPPITAAPTVEPPTQRDNTNIVQTYSVPQAEFTFQSNHPLPTVHDIDMDASTDNNGTVHINVVPRSTRNARQNARSLNRTGSSLGPGAGMKRRLPNFDFFDLGGFNGKDGFGGPGGGGKRGRFT